MTSFTQKHRMPVSLRKLLPQSSFVGCADIWVTEATEKSGECEQGRLFAAIPGNHADGRDYVEEAIQRGAHALLTPHPITNPSIQQCVTADVRKSFGKLCSAIEGNPSHQLKIAATTGTNGKTTTSWLIRSILQHAGEACGCLGTIAYSDGQKTKPSSLTTPDARTLSRWLARMVNNQTSHASIELSSHALDQDRAAGTELDVAIVTNITQDHFDYHGDSDNYFASKSRILEHLKPCGTVVLNADDPGCQKLKKLLPDHVRTLTFGIDNQADIQATAIAESFQGSQFTIQSRRGDIPTQTTLIGRHNIQNCLAAAAAANAFGLEWGTIANGISELKNVPGRLERIASKQPLNVFVDYAHTDDALRRCLSFLKTKTLGRLICVFGAGGCRDQEKRPLLGQAATLADIAVITSDNPRDEDPLAIINSIQQGMKANNTETVIEPDRYTAIEWALRNAQNGDTVLIAGKGHETEQIVGSQRIPFDDRLVAKEILSQSKTQKRAVAIQIPA